MEWFGSRGGYTIMFPRTMVRWGLGLAMVLLSAGSAYGGEYQLDTWQFTPSADTEYKVDIYGVRSPTPSKPYETWVLLHDDHLCSCTGYVPEFGYYRWHLTVGGHSPGIVGVCGNVYCRTNSCDWKSVGQIAGQSQPGLLESDTGEDAVASTAGPADAMESVVMGDWLPMRLVTLAEHSR